LVGSAVVEFALAWYLTRETGSATILATAIMLAMLPQIVLGPLIGPLVDRWDRKKTMIYADAGIAAITAALVELFLTGAIQVWHIYVAMILRAAGQTVEWTAMMASIANIVPEKDLARANGLNSALQGAINIAAPPLGALLMELLEMQWVLAVDIVTAVLAIGCLVLIVVPRPERTTLAEKASVIKDMTQGFRYVWTRRGLTLILGAVAVYGLCTTPAFSLYPILVNNHLGGDVLKLGWLNSVFGVGMIAGGLLLGVWGGLKKRILTSLLGASVMGLSIFGLGFTTERLYFFALAMSLTAGVGIATANTPFWAIMNSVVDKDMQGRVFSLVGSLSGLMTPLGLLAAGPLADTFGVKWVFIACGVGLLLNVAWQSGSKHVLNIDNLKPEAMPVQNKV
jgi:MFS transporter, DHA3 family, macrolide efflux protein